MSKRLTLIFAGLVVAYFSIYFGDGMHALAVADKALPKGKQEDLTLLFNWFGVASIGIGLWLEWLSLVGIFDLDPVFRSSRNKSTLYAISALTCLSCAFGILGFPFASYGPYLWRWTSRWDLLLVVGLVPISILIQEIVVEFVRARCNQKATDNDKVSPIHRDRDTG